MSVAPKRQASVRAVAPLGIKHFSGLLSVCATPRVRVMGGSLTFNVTRRSGVIPTLRGASRESATETPRFKLTHVTGNALRASSSKLRCHQVFLGGCVSCAVSPHGLTFHSRGTRLVGALLESRCHPVHGRCSGLMVGASLNSNVRHHEKEHSFFGAWVASRNRRSPHVLCRWHQNIRHQSARWHPSVSSIFLAFYPFAPRPGCG